MADASSRPSGAPGPTKGGVFISYRRVDTSPWALRIADHLVAALGPDQVFVDVDALSPGEDFAAVIDQTLSTCPVVLVMIGPRWLTVQAPDGSRRLDDPADLVRMEVATAFERGAEVIPVLVEGSPLPSAADLPDPLRSLANAIPAPVSARDFDAEIGALLDRVYAEVGRPRRQARAVLAAALGSWAGLAVVCAAVLALLSFIATKPDAGTVDEPDARATVEIPDGPSDLVAVDDRIWVWSEDAGELRVVDAGTAQVSSETAAQGWAPGFVVAGGSAWAELESGGAVVQVDPASGERVTTVTTDLEVSALAAEDDQVWVGLADVDARAGDEANSISRVDPDTGTLQEVVALPSAPVHMAVRGGVVWAVLNDDTMIRVAQDGSVAPAGPSAVVDGEERPVDWRPGEVAVTGDAVWVTDGSVGGLRRLDPGTGEVVATVKLVDTFVSLDRLSAASDGVWVETGRDLYLVDPVRNAVDGSFRGLDGLRAIVGRDGELWVASTDPGRLRRFDPTDREPAS